MIRYCIKELFKICYGVLVRTLVVDPKTATQVQVCDGYSSFFNILYQCIRLLCQVDERLWIIDLCANVKVYSDAFDVVPQVKML